MPAGPPEFRLACADAAYVAAHRGDEIAVRPGTASADDIQLLTNDRDLATCRALWNAVETSGTKLEPGDAVSFYRSGDTYFVPVSRHRRPAEPGLVQLDGFSSLDVYDSAYALVGRFGA